MSHWRAALAGTSRFFTFQCRGHCSLRALHPEVFGCVSAHSSAAQRWLEQSIPTSLSLFPRVRCSQLGWGVGVGVQEVPPLQAASHHLLTFGPPIPSCTPAPTFLEALYPLYPQPPGLTPQTCFSQVTPTRVFFLRRGWQWLCNFFFFVFF